MPRIDGRGYPLRASDGERWTTWAGASTAGASRSTSMATSSGIPTAAPPPAPRTKVCEETGHRYGFPTTVDGGWYRCCSGHVRKLVDCCAHHDTRINGDEALEGYCYQGRKVFCVMYFQTKVPC